MSALFLPLMLSKDTDSHSGSKNEDRSMNGSKDRDSSAATHNPVKHPYNTENTSSLPASSFVNIPNTQSMPLMRGPDAAQQATALDYGSYGSFGSLANPQQQQQQPYPWTGGEQNGVWGASGATAADQRHSSSSHHVGRGF